MNRLLSRYVTLALHQVVELPGLVRRRLYVGVKRSSVNHVLSSSMELQTFGVWSDSVTYYLVTDMATLSGADSREGPCGV